MNPFVEIPPVRRGKFLVVAEIGAGGMGVIHLALSQGPGGFERWCALKSAVRPDEASHLMLLDEARLGGRIQHPHVARVESVTTDAAGSFLVMEYLHGETLTEVMKTPLPDALVAEVIGRTAAGLHASHTCCGKDGEPLDVVHRDVSPQNIMITYDGVVKLTDFGVARARERLVGTQSDQVKGKACYCSPEQIRGEKLDARSDVFALGIVLWELLARRPLFPRDSQVSALFGILDDEIKPPRDSVGPLDRVAMRCLQRDVDDRYPDAGTVATELLELAHSNELGGWMEQHFAEQRDAKEQQLQQFSRTVESIASEPPREETRPTNRRIWAGVSWIALIVCCVLLWLQRPNEKPTEVGSVPTTQSSATPTASQSAFQSDVPAPPEPDVPERPESGEPDGRELHQAEPQPSKLARSFRVTAPSHPTPEPTTLVHPQPEQTETGSEPAESTSQPEPAVADGYLNVLARPWATIYVDDVNVGGTPIVRLPVRSGVRKVEVRWRDDAQVEQVSVEPGEVVSRVFNN